MAGEPPAPRETETAISKILTAGLCTGGVQTGEINVAGVFVIGSTLDLRPKDFLRLIPEFHRLLEGHLWAPRSDLYWPPP